MAATPNQLRANRLNAQKSTGPRTPEGKARSSQNGITHGLYAQSLLALSVEDQQQAEALRTALYEQHQPVNPTEEFLLHQLTIAAVRLQRLQAIEHGHWEHEIRYTLRKDAERAGAEPLPPEYFQDQPEPIKNSLLAAAARNEADPHRGGLTSSPSSHASAARLSAASTNRFRPSKRPSATGRQSRQSKKCKAKPTTRKQGRSRPLHLSR